MNQLGQITLEVDGELIIATLPGTSFHVIFLKTDATGLVQGVGSIDDSRNPTMREEFEQLAWTAAVEKARELGWIT